MTTHIDSDICIIGSGITAILAAERIAELTDRDIVMVEAGGRTTPARDRIAKRRRFIDYGENPWIEDHIYDQTGEGLFYRSMNVGGCAMHWDGACPRFSPEDFRQRSMYGVGTDWAIDYDELEPYYRDFEERVGVAGEPGPPEYDPDPAWKYLQRKQENVKILTTSDRVNEFKGLEGNPGPAMYSLPSTFAKSKKLRQFHANCPGKHGLQKLISWNACIQCAESAEIQPKGVTIYGCKICQFYLSEQSYKKIYEEYET